MHEEIKEWNLKHKNKLEVKKICKCLRKVKTSETTKEKILFIHLVK